MLKEVVLATARGDEGKEESRSRFANERAIVRNLNHPGIARWLDDFDEDHRAYLVLEYVPGLTMAQLVQQKGRLELEEFIQLSSRLCPVLSYLHGLVPAVVHRDLTPENILVSSTGEIKIIDFNAAIKSCRKQGERDEVMGRPKYVPPEQFRGLAVPASDIYAFGCTMFFMLTGCDPEAISQSHPILAASVPDVVDALVARATALSVSDRYQDAEQVLFDLLLLQCDDEMTS